MTNILINDTNKDPGLKTAYRWVNTASTQQLKLLIISSSGSVTLHVWFISALTAPQESYRCCINDRVWRHHGFCCWVVIYAAGERMYF